MVLESFAVSFAANAAYQISEQMLVKAMAWVQKNHPEIEEEAAAAFAASSVADAERVFEKAVDVIVAAAKTGDISIDGATLSAIRGIKFDHEDGYITIDNAKVKSNVLVTGGSVGSAGTTKISGDTSLRSAGTEIRLSGDAQIIMTGGAKITQT